MKAVICMLHSNYIHSALAPWYLLAGVKAYGLEGISAEVVEGTVNMDVEAASERIVSRKPQAVGLCCYIWNIAFIKKLLPVIKAALPDAVIILGGPEVSFNAGSVLDELTQADYVLSGEGEKPFAYLLSALYAGRETGGIPGICCRADGAPVVKAPYCPTDEPPCPYGEDYLAALGGRIAYLETSRGCPFQCAFCLSGRGAGVRFFPLERAKEELLLLAGSGTKTVKLVDRTFNADRRRAKELFSFIIDNYETHIPNGVCFHFEIGGDLLDDETLALLKTAPAGLIQFEIGLQSFHAKTLEALNRKTDMHKLKNNIERLLSFRNIHIHVDLIAGLPYEDRDTFAESFNTAYRLGPHMLQMGFLKLLYGSPMREDPEQFPCRFSEEPPYVVSATPWLTSGELIRLHDTEAVLDRLYNSGRFRRTLAYVLERTDITPFELFWNAGALLAAQIKGGISLDDLTALVFDYFSTLDGVERTALRDHMACDRLATNASGKLPPSLRVLDKRFARTVSGFERSAGHERQSGVRRGYALLYSENVLVWVEYNRKDLVTGEYPIRKYPMDDG